MVAVASIVGFSGGMTAMLLAMPAAGGAANWAVAGTAGFTGGMLESPARSAAALADTSNSAAKIETNRAPMPAFLPWRQFVQSYRNAAARHKADVGGVND